jgi:hypothetical protein
MKAGLSSKKISYSNCLHVAKKSSIINQNELFNQTKSKKRNYEH